MTTLHSIHSQVIDLPPSSIAFHLTRRDYFVVGTYDLHPEDRQDYAENSTESATFHDDDFNTKFPQRTGTLILYRLEENDTITLIATTPAPAAVLDLKWSPHDPDILAVATSTGQVAFYRLSAAASAPAKLTPESIHQVTDPSTLVLFLAFHPTHPRILGLTLSTGAVCLCTSSAPTNLWSPTAQLQLSEQATHAPLEAWVLAFLPPSRPPGAAPIDLLSGGDDATLTLTQTALGNTPPDVADPQAAPPPALSFRDRRTHAAGVTFLLPLSLPSAAGLRGAGSGGAEDVEDFGAELVESGGGRLVLTGSYDDHLRLLCVPAGSPRRPAELAAVELGGGVWRVEVLSCKGVFAETATQDAVDVPRGGGRGGVEFELLVSCMYAGARVVRLRTEGVVGAGEGGDAAEWEFEVVGRFEEHESMNYASAAQPVDAGSLDGGGARRIVSTSFYDRRMCLWRM